MAASIVWRTSPGPSPNPVSRSAVTGWSTAAAIRPTAAIISSRGISSPSRWPSAAAMDQLAVAIARQPGVPATTRALATSHTLTTTSSSAASWRPRSTSAFDACPLRIAEPYLRPRESAESRIVVSGKESRGGQCASTDPSARTPPEAARRHSADFRRFVLALKPLAAALDRGDELREVDLERVEDLVGVVLGAEPDLPLAGPSVLDDLLGGALGLLGDLLLGDELRLALARLLDDPLGLALGLGEHLLALLDDPARLLDLLRDRRAHLVENVVDLLLVHAHGVRQGDSLCVVDEVVQFVDQYEDVHCAPEVRWRAGGSFKRPAPSRETPTLY